MKGMILIMAVYIIMKKEFENEDLVVYKYGPSEKKMGKIAYNKREDRLVDIEGVNDGIQRNSFYFNRVATRLAVISRTDEMDFENRIVIES